MSSKEESNFHGCAEEKNHDIFKSQIGRGVGRAGLFSMQENEVIAS